MPYRLLEKAVAAPRAFDGEAKSEDDQLRSVECLTQAIYYEAASESEDGQRAVAQWC
jgi:spore germination cell wall hydrolase CwlJ-like protein